MSSKTMEDIGEPEEILDDEIESQIQSDDETVESDKNEEIEDIDDTGDTELDVEDIDDIEDDEDIDDDQAGEDIDDDDESDVNDIDDEDDMDNDDIDIQNTKKTAATKQKTTKKTNKPIEKLYLEKDIDDYDGDEDDDEEDENYLQKFNKEINKNYIEEIHPECVYHNYNEISALSKVIRDKNNNIIDPLHKTVPFLTKYEKTRIIGQRAKQLNSGAKPFVNVPQHIIDGNIIAELELKQKKIPFIIRRPIPGGGSEYWNVKDLELI